jgi:hypothetical protein
MNAPWTPDHGDVAMLIEAHAALSDADPLQRFIDSLSDDPPNRARSFAKDTVRLRVEFVQNVQRLLVCSDPREAIGYGEWLRRHATEVAYRWAHLLGCVQRWAARSVEPVTIRVAEVR